MEVPGILGRLRIIRFPNLLEPPYRHGRFRVWGSRFRVNPDPMINKPPPLNKDYGRDPNIKAHKKRGLLIIPLNPTHLNPKE